MKSGLYSGQCITEISCSSSTSEVKRAVTWHVNAHDCSSVQAYVIPECIAAAKQLSSYIALAMPCLVQANTLVQFLQNDILTSPHGFDVILYFCHSC